ncbi:FAD-binding oxidoreductase [Massilia forsythiae]|uniref:FAD-binding oxidoreductase n=1 Tax=Massilia forsythiae TaxID=2728020 RepID=A0A7Z2VUT4_9BURK|nr:FAD-binding oxidoreductase [Massilia forsythiae]QJD99299.1 FAD-binding oxidoreductase [Massilia forsythiae]
MKRRELFKGAAAATLLHAALPATALARVAQPSAASDLPSGASAAAPPDAAATAATVRTRVRPGTPAWPAASEWQRLRRETGGRLQALASPFARCAPGTPACAALLAGIQDPFTIGDDPALTQTSGWQDAWTSQPSAYAVAARDARDVAAAVRFARQHDLRLVVKGGGHSYLGGSSAPDSLLVWTRAMDRIDLHDAYAARGCAADTAQPAVSLGAGVMWGQAYAAVTTRAGRYVQGGGCTTVGVAGLVQGGGFGNFSKRYGSAAASLVEAEVVTADGEVRIASAHSHPDLFWALKGGGGGSFGVVTRVTLRTHALPANFGAVFGKIEAASDAAYRTLIARFVAFYQESLFNEHWGEQVSLRGGRRLQLSMVFQGLGQAEAEAVWAPFLAWVRARKEYTVEEAAIKAIPARHFWNPDFHRKYATGLMAVDDGPNASPDRFVWRGDREQAGWFIHGYQSAWLPARLLDPTRQALLADALFDAAKRWDVELHFNKGLAGAPTDALAATRDTAMNPAVLDAFALAIIAGGGVPAFPGMADARPDATRARHDGAAIRAAMDALRRAAPDAGAYVSESDYFQQHWQDAYWGANYERLARIKRTVDPDGLFFVHHGVGSEDWSADGFTRAGAPRARA